MKPRRPISPISQAHKLLLVEYHAVVLVWRALPESCTCAVCGKRKADPWPHHIIPKSVRKDLYCVIENFLAVCFWCHRQIHDNVMRSYARGLLGRSWDKLAELRDLREQHRGIPLKEWLTDRAAQLGIGVVALRLRLANGTHPQPEMRRLNARVIYVIQ